MKQIRRDIGDWGAVRVEPGQRAEVPLTVSESYAGMNIQVPVYVWRASEPGPSVFVTAAVHGDEINGAGVIRSLIVDPPFDLKRGALLLAPVVNLLGFERHSRYLPDRRDLNRCFPGSPEGSLASRLAWSIFNQIVLRCDYGIDLHTAAIRRTNFPNVRADMNRSQLAAFARAFGTELIVSSRGPKGSLRQAACRAGCLTLILEAGEVWKVEPFVVEYARRGVRNCLIHLDMIDGQAQRPAYRIEADRTHWVRAQHGGFLHFHVGPGDLLNQGDPIATSTSLLGQDQHTINAPRAGVVLGMTTLPSVAPGDPVCHLAYVQRGSIQRIERAREALPDESLHERIHQHLGSSLLFPDNGSDQPPQSAPPTDTPPTPRAQQDPSP